MPLWRSAIGRGSLRLTRVDVVVDVGVCFVSVAVLGETDSTAICQLRSQIDAARLSGSEADHSPLLKALHRSSRKLIYEFIYKLPTTQLKIIR